MTSESLPLSPLRIYACCVFATSFGLQNCLGICILTSTHLHPTLSPCSCTHIFPLTVRVTLCLASSTPHKLCVRPHREDPGALRCGSESICHAGAGLPHAVPSPHPRGGHQESQGPPWHHPQPGLLEAAPGPGPQAAAESGGMRGGEGSSGQAQGPCSPLERGGPGGRYREAQITHPLL